MSPRIVDIFLLNVKPVIRRALRQIIHDKSWSAPNIDDALFVLERKIFANGSDARGKEAASLLKFLVNYR